MPKLANFKVSKDTLLKVGIAAAVAVILYLVLRSVTCSKREGWYGKRRRERYATFAAPRRSRREGYAMFASPRRGRPADDEYAENMFEAMPAPVDDYAEEDYYAEAGDDVVVEGAEGGQEEVATEEPTPESRPDYYVMESTLDDEDANAQFAPDA